MNKRIHKEMLSWYGVNLTDTQIKEYLDKNPCCKYYFDTIEREDFVQYLAKKINNMRFPLYGDKQGYKDAFFGLLKVNSNIKGYDWNFS